MDSIRIYQLKSSFSKNEIAERMLNQSYTFDNSLGFHIEKSNEDIIKGEYFFKQVFTEELSDPIGNMYENTIIKIDNYKFEIFFDSSIMFVFNAPNSLSFFINKIGNLLDNKVVINPIRLNLIDFSNSCKTLFDSVLINSLEISGIYFSSSTLGSSRISGNEDVIQYLDLYKKNKFPIEIKKLRMKAEINNLIFNISFSSLGTIWIPNKHKSYLIEILIKATMNYLK